MRELQNARPPVHHQVLEFTQTHAHRVGDVIQPSHPLLSPSPPAPNSSIALDGFPEPQGWISQRFWKALMVQSVSCLQSPLQFSSVAQSCLNFWTAACQTSLLITNSWSLLKLMCIEPVMPSNHLILCRPLLLLPSIFPSIRVLSNESVLCIR